MELVENSSYEVLAIPLEVIRNRREYLSVELFNDKKALHELHCFVREVCSKNAYPFQDILNIVLNSKESFSPTLYKMLRSLSKKQFNKTVEAVILKRVSDGYPSSIKYHKHWKAMAIKGKPLIREVFFRRWLKNLNILKETFYYYDAEFVNLFTTPDSDLPLYLNYEWPSKEDDKFYKDRMHSLDEKNQGYKKPNFEGVACGP